MRKASNGNADLRIKQGDGFRNGKEKSGVYLRS